MTFMNLRGIRSLIRYVTNKRAVFGYTDICDMPWKRLQSLLLSTRTEGDGNNSTSRPVRRDGQWNTIIAEELVPDDLIHQRQGTIVPADGAGVRRLIDAGSVHTHRGIRRCPNPGRQDRLCRHVGAGRRSHRGTIGRSCHDQ
jgi:hypothetical protein